MKGVSGVRIEEGIIIGLAVAAIVGLALAAYRSWQLSTETPP